ncbi:Fc.00g109750.m01.CDS01 [Cosmosporella sp. VM-42]
MVGVPGKYKGCETCRRRRVKCSNERPFCQKCIASGRECEGYERVRVFITGTPETKGRVASHPKKASSTKKPKNAAGEDAKPELVPLQPFTSAWDDHTVVSSQGIEYSVLITALHTMLQAVLRDDNAEEDSAGFRISFPPYSPSELQASPAEENLSVSAQCLARLPGNDDGDDAESYCVFLFELKHNLSVAAWELGPGLVSVVRRLGPAHFSSFPNHHYFVRVYRPLAVSLALLNRRDTFLSAPEWTTVPWAEHPKCLVDQLFDLILLLPSIFARTDLMKPLEATLSRRHMAQELLQSCLSLEQHFDSWLRLANQGTEDEPFAYWAEELTSPGGLIPFSNSYTFKDGITGLRFLYYWMSQILFHRCIESLHRTIFQPVIDAYPNMWPDLPPNLQIDVTRYQHCREFAADICRGLDSALDSTVQPDMLVAPMTVAMEFYKEINTTSQDGAMEIMWLENFRLRLIEKGQHIADVLQKQKWVEVARF